ncbi:hypothetical protein [Flammeovirga sp. OC4]|uniref:hypothetical protein n=1 Tax=Flammeovirga sp. OC4 TaxID=1382345 RepID=UPI0005C60D73|nr:hypothetical protein [Flammeovirga sp. OC4]
MKAIVWKKNKIYINGVSIGSCTSVKWKTEQPSNEVPLKANRHNDINEHHQIDALNVDINLNGLGRYNEDTLFDFVEWAKNKTVKTIRITNGTSIGDRFIQVDARCTVVDEGDESKTIKYNVGLKGIANFKQGKVVPEPLYTFTSAKTGIININATGVGTDVYFLDQDGNPLSMPYEAAASREKPLIINMYDTNGKTLADYTELTAVNCGLIGIYDFSAWVKLTNADLEGNAFDEIITIDEQFDTGTLSVMNSFVDATKFSTFILAFNSIMTTSRSSVLDVGTIDDPLMLESGTLEHSAITSLNAKGWTVSVVSNKLLTATIEGSRIIQPSGVLTAEGSLLYTLNGEPISNITYGDINPNSFDVKTGDVLECWYANVTNDLLGLSVIELSSSLLTRILSEDLILSSTVKIVLKNNPHFDFNELYNEFLNYQGVITMSIDAFDHTNQVGLDISLLKWRLIEEKGMNIIHADFLCKYYTQFTGIGSHYPPRVYDENGNEAQNNNRYPVSDDNQNIWYAIASINSSVYRISNPWRATIDYSYEKCSFKNITYPNLQQLGVTGDYSQDEDGDTSNVENVINKYKNPLILNFFNAQKNINLLNCGVVSSSGGNSGYTYPASLLEVTTTKDGDFSRCNQLQELVTPSVGGGPFNVVLPTAGQMKRVDTRGWWQNRGHKVINANLQTQASAIWLRFADNYRLTSENEEFDFGDKPNLLNFYINGLSRGKNASQSNIKQLFWDGSYNEFDAKEFSFSDFQHLKIFRNRWNWQASNWDGGWTRKHQFLDELIALGVRSGNDNLLDLSQGNVHDEFASKISQLEANGWTMTSLGLNNPDLT